MSCVWFDQQNVEDLTGCVIRRVRRFGLYSLTAMASFGFVLSFFCFWFLKKASGRTEPKIHSGLLLHIGQVSIF